MRGDKNDELERSGRTVKRRKKEQTGGAAASLSRERGAVVMRRKPSRNGSTPKFVSALPKNTGESVPFRTASRSNSRPAPSSSISSARLSRRFCPMRSTSAGSSSAISVTPAFFAWPASVKWMMHCFSRS